MSCTENQLEGPQIESTNNKGAVYIDALINSPSDTRISFSDSGFTSAISLDWQTDDTFTLYNVDDNTDTRLFTLISGNTFQTEDGALESGVTYYAEYNNSTEGDYSYTQIGSELNHLSDLVVMQSDENITAESTQIVFSHAKAIVRMKYNIEGVTPSSIRYNDTITNIDINYIQASAGENYAYIAVDPTTFSRTMYIDMISSDGTIYSFTKEGISTEYVAGYVYDGVIDFATNQYSNLLTNGTFETSGSVDAEIVGWSDNANSYCVRATDYYISGDASLRFGSANNAATIAQKVTLEAGKNYRFLYTGRSQQSYDSQTAAATTTTLTAYLAPASSTDAATPDLDNAVISSSVSTHENTTNLYEFTIEESGEYFVWFAKSGRICYLDNVALYQIDEIYVPVIHPGTNIISNPGFETGNIESWSLITGNTAVDTTASGLVISGVWTLRMSGKGYANITQSVTLNPGSTYSFGFTGRILNSASASGADVYLEGSYLTVNITNDNGQLCSLTVASNYDTKVSGTFTVPDGDPTTASVAIVKSGGIASIDDIYLIEEY